MTLGAAGPFAARNVNAIALAVCLQALLGCAAERGDFGRIQPSTYTETVNPDAGRLIATLARGEVLSDFNKTDREVSLRERAWPLVLPPHARDWFGDWLVEMQRTRVLPEIDSRYDVKAYYALLRRDPARSSETRWRRLVADMRADAALVGPFWTVAATVKGDDDRRMAAYDSHRDHPPKELTDLYARIDENARVVDWVWRAMRFRLKSYRHAIDRMEVETPTDTLIEVNLAWQALQQAIADAELGTDTLFRRRAVTDPIPSRYKLGAGIEEKVPQK